MSSTLRIIIVLLFITTFAGCSMFSRRYTKLYTGENRVTAAGKKRFTLDNTNGRIKVSHTNEDFIIIKYDIERKVKKSELEDAKKSFDLRIDSLSSLVKVEVDEPEEHGFVFGNSFRANFEIFVPDGIDIEINNANGNLIFDEMGNNITADLTNGSVDLQSNTGVSKVSIANGSLNATIDSTKGMDVEIINGNIRLKTKKNFSGQISTDIVHGKFTHEGIDFSKIKGDRDDKNYSGFKEFDASIGNSEAKLKYSVTNGNISIIALEKTSDKVTEKTNDKAK